MEVEESVTSRQSELKALLAKHFPKLRVYTGYYWDLCRRKWLAKPEDLIRLDLSARRQARPNFGDLAEPKMFFANGWDDLRVHVRSEEQFGAAKEFAAEYEAQTKKNVTLIKEY